VSVVFYLKPSNNSKSKNELDLKTRFSLIWLGCMYAGVTIEDTCHDTRESIKLELWFTLKRLY
jgi:hypothetical protein